jgi:TRAP-type C4-dicarboxylate transport system substrate-binding protein
MSDRSTRRRTFLKVAGAAGAASVLAGCTGGNGNGGNGNGNGGNGNGNGGNGNGNGSSAETTVEDIEDLPEIEMTWHHLGTPDPTLHNHRQALTFKNYMETNSGGRFTVNIAPAGELAGDVESVEQAQAGAIEIVAGIAEGHVAPFLPDINTMALPYAYPSIDVANYVWDNTEFGIQFRNHMEEEMDVVPVGWYDNGGFRHYTSNEPLEGPDSLEGQTIRNMDIEAHMEITRQLGATPEPIDWTELYQALDTGVVDGQENALPTLTLQNLQEVQDYAMLDGHVFSINFALASGQWYNDLHPAYQTMVNEAAQLGSMHSRMVNRIQRAQLQTVFTEEYDMEIYQPTASEMETFRERTQEPVGEIIREEVDDTSWIELQQESIEEAVEQTGFDPTLQ